LEICSLTPLGKEVRVGRFLFVSSPGWQATVNIVLPLANMLKPHVRLFLFIALEAIFKSDPEKD
jgi:hypothetical protein